MSRVWNLSHHKCATTSVHKALGILGLKSHHCEDPDRLVKVHLEGSVASDPLLGEDNTAWGDLPIPFMYRALYEAFPMDTFIFVRRAPDSWVESLRRHLSAHWSVPLPIHTFAYGYPITASNFDERTCLRAYERICMDILEFFSGKRNFHLIEFADLSWRTLCAAVGKPEPDLTVPFPWEKRGLYREPFV